MKLYDAFRKQLSACGDIRRVWLTSFNIDIEFIETYLLSAVLGADVPRARGDFEALQLILNERGIDFRVFCDKRFIQADQNKRTLIPVHGVLPDAGKFDVKWGFPEGSLFHAKVIYIEGEKGKVLGAGSANLTLSGWGRNREVFHFVPVDEAAIYKSLTAFFKNLFVHAGEDFPLPGIRKWARDRPRARFCHSFDDEVFFSQLIGDKKHNELAVWSPYFSADLAAFIRHLKERYDQPDMVFRVVADRVEGKHIRTRWSDDIAELLASGELAFYQSPVLHDDHVTMTHAKLWKTKSHLAIGSWNFTYAGSNTQLDDDGNFVEQANIEAGFILGNNEPVASVLGRPLDVSHDMFASESLMQEEALVVPEPLPFDIVVQFDWSTLRYSLSMKKIRGVDSVDDYLISLPDIENPVPVMSGGSMFKTPELLVDCPNALLKDHRFHVFRGETLCYTGLLIERSPVLRRAQQYDDLGSLLDAMVHIGPDPSVDDVSYRVAENDEGMELAGVSSGQAEGDSTSSISSAGDISYFRLFTASYQYAERLREIQYIGTLEHWGFSRPGCLEELTNKAAERIAAQPGSVFGWFLAMEVNSLCDLARERRKALPKDSKAVSPARWRALGVPVPSLPAQANQDYRQMLEDEYLKMKSGWGAMR